MARVIGFVVVIALSIYALIDCARTPSEQTPARISKPVWLLLILVLPILGPGIWLYFKYQDVLNSDQPLSPGDLLHPRKPAGPSAPLAPDDDPEFLARLDAVNRRKAYEQRKAAEKKRREEDDGEDKTEEETPQE